MPNSLSRLQLTGVCSPARGAVVAQALQDSPAPVWLVVAPDLKIAEQLAEDAAFFADASGRSPAPRILVLPESMPTDGDMREAFAASADRTTVLSRLRATRGTNKISGSKAEPLHCHYIPRGTHPTGPRVGIVFPP